MWQELSPLWASVSSSVKLWPWSRKVLWAFLILTFDGSKGSNITTASYDILWDINLCFFLYFLFPTFLLQVWVQERFASGLRTWEDGELCVDKSWQRTRCLHTDSLMPWSCLNWAECSYCSMKWRGRKPPRSDYIYLSATRQKWKKILIEDTKIQL